MLIIRLLHANMFQCEGVPCELWSQSKQDHPPMLSPKCSSLSLAFQLCSHLRPSFCHSVHLPRPSLSLRLFFLSLSLTEIEEISKFVFEAEAGKGKLSNILQKIDVML
jgi:hypothetical protein